MIQVARLAKQVEKFVADNSPAILTGVGVVGTVAVTYLSGRATYKASLLLEDERARRVMMSQPEMTKTDVVKVVWTEYIPVIGTAGITIACIICANRIGTRRAAAMAAAYAVSNKNFQEYKEKVTEKLGINKERAARDELAQDKVNNNPPPSVVVVGTGDVIFFDQPTERYFKNDMETVRRIENDLNQQIIHDGYATLSDLYVALGLASTPYSEELGWGIDNFLQINFSAVMTPENQPCIAIDYKPELIRGYKRLQD